MRPNNTHTDNQILAPRDASAARMVRPYEMALRRRASFCRSTTTTTTTTTMKGKRENCRADPNALINALVNVNNTHTHTGTTTLTFSALINLSPDSHALAQ